MSYSPKEIPPNFIEWPGENAVYIFGAGLEIKDLEKITHWSDMFVYLFKHLNMDGSVWKFTQTSAG